MHFRQSIAAVVAAACLSTAASQSVFAQAADAPATAETADNTKTDNSTAYELPPLPESFDQSTVSSYIEKLNRIRPKERSRESMTSLVEALSARIDELLAKPIDGEAAREAVGFRFALFGIAQQLGVPGVSETKTKWIASLGTDKRPEIALMGRGLSLLESTQTPAIATGDREAWEKLLNATDSLLAETNASPFAANITMQISEMSEMAAPADIAAKAHASFAKRFAESDADNVRQAAPVLAGVGRKLGLPGSKMEITGTTLEGEPFDLSQLEGKVVLVEFWASWCGECVKTFPALTKLYQKHHDAGFEVVGVNIDETKSLWTEYLDSNPLPWMHVQNLGSGETNRHPNADRYGVNAIPFMVLIGRDGRVIETNVVVQELDTLVPKALAGKAN